jgi:hypothetical protein
MLVSIALFASAANSNGLASVYVENMHLPYHCPLDLHESLNYKCQDAAAVGQDIYFPQGVTPLEFAIWNLHEEMAFFIWVLATNAQSVACMLVSSLPLVLE